MLVLIEFFGSIEHRLRRIKIIFSRIGIGSNAQQGSFGGKEHPIRRQFLVECPGDRARRFSQPHEDAGGRGRGKTRPTQGEGVSVGRRVAVGRVGEAV